MEAPAAITSFSQNSAANIVNDTCETFSITDMTRFGFVAFIQWSDTKLHNRSFKWYALMYGIKYLCMYIRNIRNALFIFYFRA